MNPVLQTPPLLCETTEGVGVVLFWYPSSLEPYWMALVALRGGRLAHLPTCAIKVFVNELCAQVAANDGTCDW